MTCPAVLHEGCAPNGSNFDRLILLLDTKFASTVNLSCLWYLVLCYLSLRQAVKIITTSDYSSQSRLLIVCKCQINRPNCVRCDSIFLENFKLHVICSGCLSYHKLCQFYLTTQRNQGPNQAWNVELITSWFLWKLRQRWHPHIYFDVLLIMTALGSPK